MSHIQEVDAETKTNCRPSTSPGPVNTVPAIEQIRPSGLSTLSEALDEKNWATWHKRMTLLLKVCHVEDYVNGTLSRPNAITDPQGADNWSSNDEYAKHLILVNVSATQLNHVDPELDSHQVWSTLVSIHQPSLHQPQGFHTMSAHLHALFHMTAAEDENIPDYINKMKSVVEQVNLIRHTGFKIDNIMFQSILAQSLPTSWHTFKENLFRADVTDEDPASALSTIQFIRKLKDEYYYRIGRKDNDGLLGAQQTVIRKKSLVNRMTGTEISSAYCSCCKKRNHTTDQCRHLGKPLCVNCGRFGHTTANCWTDAQQNLKKRSNDDNDDDDSNNTNDNRPFKKLRRSSASP